MYAILEMCRKEYVSLECPHYGNTLIAEVHKKRNDI